MKHNIALISSSLCIIGKHFASQIDTYHGANVTTHDDKGDWSVGDSILVAISNPVIHEDNCSFGRVRDVVEKE